MYFKLIISQFIIPSITKLVSTAVLKAFNKYIFLPLYKLTSSLLPYIIIISIWQMVIIVGGFPNFILPSFFAVVKSIIANRDILLQNAAVTTFEAVVGLLLGVIFAVILGSLFSYLKLFKRLIYQMILIWQIIPLMAIAPLILIWVGFGVEAKILVVFLCCLFPCLIAFLAGMQNVSPELVDLMKSMGAKRLDIFKFVELPSSLYGLFTGLKIAVIYSLTSAVVAEYMGANKGLGIYMSRVMASLDSAALFGDILCIIVITLILYKLVVLVEKIFTPWKKNMPHTLV